MEKPQSNKGEAKAFTEEEKTLDSVLLGKLRTDFEPVRDFSKDC